MKPTIVIVHGAWHVPEHYRPFVERLQAHGFEVHVPHLPSSGNLAAQSRLEDDVNVVSKLLHELGERSRQIIVVAHSYGGVVATQALKEHLDNDHEVTQGSQKILHLIYMCAFMLQPGESIFAVSQPRPDPDPLDPGDDGTCFLSQSLKDLFYGDVDDGLVKKCEKLLERHSLAALAGPIEYPAWKYIPTTYLKCTQDNAILLNWQNRLVQAVQDAGVSLEVETYQASHSPYLSRTAEMAEAVDRVARRYEAKNIWAKFRANLRIISRHMPGGTDLRKIVRRFSSQLFKH